MAKQNKLPLLVIAVVLIAAAIFYLSTLSAKPSIPQANDIILTTEPTDLPPDYDPDAERISDKEGKYPKAPELVGISGYLNADDITIGSQRGKVVLIDFWTYTCINCIRTLPFITEWDRKYRDKGLVIIGVHTPEFSFEKKYDNVAAAMKKHGIEYPVVQDNDYLTWRAFGNHYWPRKYLIDQDGFIRYDHIGEGGYEETERMIQDLLEELGEKLTVELTEETRSIRRSTTAELYGGSDFSLPRGQDIGNDGGLKAGVTVVYTLPDSIPKDKITLDGSWTSNPDDLEAVRDATLYLNFLAGEVNIVAEPTDGPLKMYVSIDGEPITPELAGSDVITEPGRSYVIVASPSLYNLVDGEYGRYELTLAMEDGIRINAFTFG